MCVVGARPLGTPQRLRYSSQQNAVFACAPGRLILPRSPGRRTAAASDCNCARRCASSSKLIQSIEGACCACTAAYAAGGRNCAAPGTSAPTNFKSLNGFDEET